MCHEHFSYYHTNIYLDMSKIDSIIAIFVQAPGDKQ